MSSARSTGLTLATLLVSAAVSGAAMAQAQPTPPPPKPAGAAQPAAAAEAAPPVAPPVAPPAGQPAGAAPTQPEPAKTEAPPLEAPPPPPPAGAKDATPEPPPSPPKAFPIEPEVTAKNDGPPLAGWNGGFFLRDPHDYFRLYPRGRLQLDFNSFFGPGVKDIPPASGGNALKSRLFMRRARFEVAGEFLRNVTFHFAVEDGAQPTSNTNGRTQTAASGAGKAPTDSSASWAAVQAPTASASLADNWINYSFCPCLNFMLGQYDAPFSMENRTSDTVSDWMELNLAIRGFLVPSKKEIGLTVWGELGEKNLNYEIGVFTGDGQNRAQIDNSVDFIGRIFARPLAKKDSKDLLAKAQIGVSMRHGDRDQTYVGYSYPAITSSQGFALWDPRYRDSQGRTTQIIPSGAQNAIGGEIRLPLSIVDLRAEAYYAVNNTREAIDGYQLSNTERLGQIKGLGWYASVAAWVLGDSYVNGDPGFMRPTKVDLSKDPGKPKRGLELLAIVAGVDASYLGASRGGTPDANTPGGSGTPATIKMFEYGFGANYWYTKHLRASVNYIIYHTPDSGAADKNIAVVPGNASADATTKASAHLLHELSTRVAVSF